MPSFSTDTTGHSTPFSEVNKRDGNPLRHGIIHAQITTAETLSKIRQGELIVYIQPVFVPSDKAIVEPRIGRKRMQTSYAWKRMHDLGIRIVGGSDAPVESFCVLKNIHAAVARTDTNGFPRGGWLPEQKPGRKTAIRLFTADAAYASFEEDLKGTLEVGKLADMVVIDKNIVGGPTADRLTATVSMTVMDGKVVFEKEA